MLAVEIASGACLLLPLVLTGVDISNLLSTSNCISTKGVHGLPYQRFVVSR